MYVYSTCIRMCTVHVLIHMCNVHMYIHIISHRICGADAGKIIGGEHMHTCTHSHTWKNGVSKILIVFHFTFGVMSSPAPSPVHGAV